MNIGKLITFIFKNKTIFWDISKWNKEQKSGTEIVHLEVSMFDLTCEHDTNPTWVFSG